MSTILDILSAVSIVVSGCLLARCIFNIADLVYSRKQREKLIQGFIVSNPLKINQGRYFPRATKFAKIGLIKQTEKLLEEAEEVFVEVRKCNYERVAEEALDAIHVAEGLLDMCAEQGVDIEFKKKYVYDKNNARKYYGEQPVVTGLRARAIFVDEFRTLTDLQE